MDFGASVTMVLTGVPGYWHKIKYTFMGRTYESVVGTVGAGFVWTVSTDPNWMVEIPTTTSEILTFTSTSYAADDNSGAYPITIKTASVLVKVPLSVAPIIGDFTAERIVDPTFPAAITGYVQGYCKIKLTAVGVQPAYGSGIAAYTISGAGYTATTSTATFGTIHQSGILSFLLTVRDLRGRISVRRVDVPVLAYNSPSPLLPEAFRSDALGVADRAGAYVTLLSAGASFSDLNGQNAATVEGRFYLRGATPGAFSLMSPNIALVLGGTLLPTKTYVVEIKTTDLLNTNIVQVLIPTDLVAWHFIDGVAGGAVGKYAEIEGAFESAWPIFVQGQHIALQMFPIGYIYMSVSAVSPAELFGGVWAAIGGMFLLGANATYPVNSTGGNAVHNHTLGAGYAMVYLHTDSGHLGARTKATASYTQTHYHNHAAVAIAYNIARARGVELGGTTDFGSTLPPYLAVYMWKRTA